MGDEQLSPFGRLPPELQLLILRQVYAFDAKTYLTYLGDHPEGHHPEPEPLRSKREQLKPFRLISRLFHDAVTPTIFSSIHLHASKLSMQRADNIANSPHAHHVREIVHHEGTFNGASTDKQQFLTMLISNRRRQDYPKNHHFFSTEELYHNYLEEVTAGREFEGWRVDRMTELLQKLPRCITFTTLCYDTEWGDPLTSAYTLRRTGLSYLPRRTDSPNGSEHSFISSMSQWKPKTLNLMHFPYYSLYVLLQFLSSNPFLETHDAAIRNWADQLTYLKVGWPDHIRAFFYLPQSLSNYASSLALLFSSCHSLVHLELTHGFGFIPSDLFLHDDNLPRLTRLTLSGDGVDTPWNEDYLLLFIQRLGATLKHIHFQGIGIYRVQEAYLVQGALSGSLLRLLFNITSCTNLESCTGLETVLDIKSSVGLKQSFVVLGHKPGKLAILDKVQDAVCGRRPWPEGFDMKHWPMWPLGSAAPDIQDAAIANEVAFLYSRWNDTVDPWNVNGDHEAIVEEESDPELEELQSSVRQSGLEGQKGEVKSTKALDAPSSSKPIKSKRSRISEILRLK